MGSRVGYPTIRALLVWLVAFLVLTLMLGLLSPAFGYWLGPVKMAVIFILAGVIAVWDARHTRQNIT